MFYNDPEGSRVFRNSQLKLLANLVLEKFTLSQSKKQYIKFFKNQFYKKNIF